MAWCVENGVSLINMSLGSTQSKDYQKLKDCIDYAEKHGVVIVAAIHNRNIRSFPASFSNVIGVSCDFTLENDEYCMAESDITGIDIFASAKHNIKYPTSFVNSFAAPLVTAEVANVLNEYGIIGIARIKEIMAKMAINIKSPVMPALELRYKSENSPEVPQEKADPTDHQNPCVVILVSTQIELAIITTLNQAFIDSDYNTLYVLVKKEYDPSEGYACQISHINNFTLKELEHYIDSDVIIIGLSEDELSNKIDFDCDILFNCTKSVQYKKHIRAEEEFEIDLRLNDISATLFNQATKILS